MQLARPVPVFEPEAHGRATRPEIGHPVTKAATKLENPAFSPDRTSRIARTVRALFTLQIDMNRRYAYRDYEILVSALPTAGQTGWRPEICIIAPDERWAFVPTHKSMVSADAGHCLEIGRRCAENAIHDLQIDQEVAGYEGYWH